MKRTVALSLLVVALCCCAREMAAQAVVTVDTRWSTSSGSGAGDHVRSPSSMGRRRDDRAAETLPVELTVTMDRTAYEIFDPFTYWVTIRNVGHKPLALPRDVSRAAVAGPQRLNCLIHLQVTSNPAVADAAMGVAELFGSPEDPSTVATLAPGQSMEVIVAGKWEFLLPADTNALMKALPQRVGVSAVISLRNADGPRYSPVQSKSGMAVLLSSTDRVKKGRIKQ